ncbi:putative C-type lectin domain family 20 member A isoform X1, partial [Clarias magur]
VVPVIQGVYRKYHAIPTGKTWNDALAYCRATYIDLASYENKDQATQLKNLAQSQNITSSLWIGLYNDINSWRWSMGNEPLGSSRYWYSPNPKNLNSNQYCAGIDTLGWFDHECSAKQPFICFDGRYTGSSSYIYISDNMTWSEAQRYCRANHTDLASARNTAENSVLLAMVSGGTWFGLFRDSWKWSDSTNFTFMAWVPGEPNNLLGQEYCVFFTGGSTGDVLCSRIKPFFCEAVITGQQQILRVKVQSSQDVNDPAVKAAMLDK